MKRKIQNNSAKLKEMKYTDSRVFMNTTIEITLFSDLGTIKSMDLLDKAFEQFAYVMKKFTRFDDQSYLSKINKSSGNPMLIDQETSELVKVLIELRDLSKGKFDPTVIDLLEKYGYDKTKDFSRVGSEVLKKEIKEYIKTRPNSFELKLQNRKIHLVKGQRIDLGSIGKGYAVDLAVSVLEPAQNFLINAGGDVFAKGKNKNGEEWKVGLRIPNSEDIFGFINLNGKSLASSGSWAIKYKAFHHLLDTSSGKPLDNLDQVFVVDKNAKWADGYATMLFLMGEEGLSLLEKKKVGGLIIKDKRAQKNKYFPEILN